MNSRSSNSCARRPLTLLLDGGGASLELAVLGSPVPLVHLPQAHAVALVATLLLLVHFLRLVLLDPSPSPPLVAHPFLYHMCAFCVDPTGWAANCQ